MRNWIEAAVVTTVLLFGMPLVLAGDGFEARSRLLSGRAVATNYSLLIADFQAMADAATKKYGPESKTVSHPVASPTLNAW